MFLVIISKLLPSNLEIITELFEWNRLMADGVYMFQIPNLLVCDHDATNFKTIWWFPFRIYVLWHLTEFMNSSENIVPAAAVFTKKLSTKFELK